MEVPMTDIQIPQQATESLAELVRRWHAQVEAYGELPDDLADDERDAIADATFHSTLHEMPGVPVLTKDAALAAIRVHKGAKGRASWRHPPGYPIDTVVLSMLDGLRRYVEAR
jgi:hypothetical protein